MYQLLQAFARHCGLSQHAYWCLRLVGSVSLVPVLVSAYLLVFEKRPRHSLWVAQDGRLVAGVKK